jgi:hypothetical protein
MKPNYFLRGLVSFFRKLLQILIYLFVFQWLTDLIKWIGRLWSECRRGKKLRDSRLGRPAHCAPRCIIVPPKIYKRADPMIYSQFYLMEQGLGVTWDNPDIQLFDNGLPVSSDLLKADHDYEVVATIYNNSTDAPAVALPVVFSFLSFGAGMVSNPMGTTKIDLPVKGAPGHPARAKMKWHTPATAGHYCLQVRLIWADDANPKNNLGQENTNVGVAASPATFTFPVRNDDTIRKLIKMVADAYTIPPPLDCQQRPSKKDSKRRYANLVRPDLFVPPTEAKADWTLARARHGQEAFPIPAGWKVDIKPHEFELAPGDQTNVTVAINPPADFRGERPFNINATFGGGLLGGVTLKVRRS